MPRPTRLCPRGAGRREPRSWTAEAGAVGQAERRGGRRSDLLLERRICTLSLCPVSFCEVETSRRPLKAAVRKTFEGAKKGQEHGRRARRLAVSLQFSPMRCDVGRTCRRGGACASASTGGAHGRPYCLLRSQPPLIGCGFSKTARAALAPPANHGAMLKPGREAGRRGRG